MVSTGAFVSKITRLKDINSQDDDEFMAEFEQTKLKKCLTTFDLTSLGIGSCVGTGMYLVGGMVARIYAGPAVALSFTFAAIASILSGLCYAEFGVRVPHTSGSAYMYSYVTVGELIAFVIGWNLILEYLIGTSACACALSACFNSISRGRLNEFIGDVFGTWRNGEPPDVIAFLITVLITVILAIGIKKSLLFNNVLNAINFVVWIFIMVVGSYYARTTNWTEHGGFFPKGLGGVFQGSATCFYAFIGFDIIATTGEEANNPKKSIPRAILFSLTATWIAYVSSSLMLTLIVPYDMVSTQSALVDMFGQVGAYTCQWVVAVGALAGLTVSMFGSMFPMPRVIYAMSKDGLIFRPLSKIFDQTNTPVRATVVSGTFASLASLILNLQTLVEMMSIGTLLAYTLVSTSVLLLRYQPDTDIIPKISEEIRNKEETGALEVDEKVIPKANIKQLKVPQKFLDKEECSEKLLGTPSNKIESYGATYITSPPMDKSNNEMKSEFGWCPIRWTYDTGPSVHSAKVVLNHVLIIYILSIILNTLVIYSKEPFSGINQYLVYIFCVGILFVTASISRYPQSRQELAFKVPWIPVIPVAAIVVNIHLILNLSSITLVRFCVWMIIGFAIYFWYGIEHSTLEQRHRRDKFEKK